MKTTKIVDKRIEYYANLPDCSVCYQKMGKYKLTLGCGHSYHEKCIFNWIEQGKDTCPLCREQFMIQDFPEHYGITEIKVLCLIFVAFTVGGMVIFILDYCVED